MGSGRNKTTSESKVAARELTEDLQSFNDDERRLIDAELAELQAKFAPEVELDEDFGLTAIEQALRPSNTNLEQSNNAIETEDQARDQDTALTIEEGETISLDADATPAEEPVASSSANTAIPLASSSRPPTAGTPSSSWKVGTPPPSSTTNAPDNQAANNPAAPTPVMSISAMNEPAALNEANSSNSPPIRDEAANTNSNAPDDTNNTQKEQAHTLKRLKSHGMLLNFFEAICSKIDSSAYSREPARINDIIRTTSALQAKLEALQESEEQAVIQSMLDRCAVILKTLNSTMMPPQNQLLSYATEKPVSYNDQKSAMDALQNHFNKSFENSAEKVKMGLMGSISSEREQTTEIPLPGKEQITNHYFDIAAADGSTIKTGAINYDAEAGKKEATNQYRSDLYMDPNTFKNLGNDPVKFGWNMLTSTLPRLDVMTWARNVLNTFLADDRATPPLQFNFPNLPKTCMFALVLQAKMQGVPVSRYSNFRGMVKPSDVRDCHVEAYANMLKKEKATTAPSKEPGDYSVTEIKDEAKKLGLKH